MTQENTDYIETTVYKFKTHFSRYVRLLEQGLARGVVVKRYNKPIGLFVTVKKTGDKR